MVESNNTANTIIDGSVPGISIDARDKSTIKSISGAIGLSATAAVGGGAAYNDIKNTIESYVGPGSTLTTEGNIIVASESDATIETISAGGSLAVYGAVSGSVPINIIENDVLACINGATSATSVTADDNVYVLADSDNIIHSYGGALSGRLIGAAGAVVTNMVENTTRAYANHATVNARGTGDNIRVKNWTSDGTETTEDLKGLFVIADTNEEVEIYSGSAAAGGLTASGQVSVNKVSDTTEAYIAASTINSSSDYGEWVKVKAHQDKDLSELYAGGLSIGGVAVGGAVDRTSISNTTQAFISDSDESGDDPSPENSSVYARGVEVKSQAKERYSPIIAGASLAGGIAVAGAVSVVDIDNDNDAFIKNSDVSSRGDLSVVAIDDAEIDTMAGTFSGSSYVGAGGSVVVSSIDNTTRARVIGSHLNATDATQVRADTDESIDALLGTAGVGTLAGLAGAVPVNSIETTTEATIDSGSRASLINQDAGYQPGGAYSPGSGQTVLVEANNTARIDDDAGSLGVGAGGVGASIDVASIRNRTVARVGKETKIYAKGDVDVKSLSDRQIESDTGAVGAGLFGLSGAISAVSVGSPIDSDGASEFNGDLRSQVNSDIATQDLKVNDDDPTASKAKQKVNAMEDPSVDDALDTAADVGDRITSAYVENAGSSSSRAEIVSGGDITIQSSNRYDVADIDSDGIGWTGAAVAAGSVITETKINGGANAYMGNNATVGSVSQKVGSLTVEATSDNLAKSYSEAVAGGVAAGAAADADSYIEPETKAYTGNYSEVYTTGDINLSANSTNDVDSQIDGRSGGLAAKGVMNAKAETKSIKTKAYTGSNSELHSDGNVKLDSQVDNTAYTKARGGVGGLLAGGGQEAFSQLNSVKTDSYIGSGGKVYAEDGTLEIKSTSYGNVESDTSFDTGGLITRNEVKSTSRILDSDTQARILGDADIRVNILDMKSNDEDLFTKAKSYSKTYAADSESDGTSEVDLDARSYAFVGANADIMAPEKISIIANQNSVKTEADSKTEIKVGLTGELSATADNNLTSKADVVTESGSTMETRDLFVKAYAPHFLQNIYIRKAETEAQTVTYYVKEFVGYACKIVVDILCLGIFCDGEEVCEPVYEWVAHVLHSEENRILLGSKSVSNSIDFNSELTVSGSGDPWLTVDAIGNVTADGITYTSDASQVTVDDMVNDTEGKITIDAKHGTVTGTATFNMNQAFGSVTITNNSSKHLNINDVEVINTNQTEPALSILGDSSGFDYTVNTNLYDTIIDISNNNIADADVSLLGHILNPRGSTDIYNRGATF